MITGFRAILLETKTVRNDWVGQALGQNWTIRQEWVKLDFGTADKDNSAAVRAGVPKPSRRIFPPQETCVKNDPE